MIIWLWDKQNDEPTILGDDGEFYFYSEDQVAIRKGEGGRHWTKLNKMQDVTPLNDPDRHQIMDPFSGAWYDLGTAEGWLVKTLHLMAGDPDYKDVI